MVIHLTLPVKPCQVMRVRKWVVLKFSFFYSFCRARRIGHSIEVKRRGAVNRWEEMGLELEQLVLNNIPKFHIATWDIWEDHVFQGRSGFPK